MSGFDCYNDEAIFFYTSYIFFFPENLMKLECCWFNPEHNPLECPNIEEGDEYLYSSQRKRLVEKCLDCPVFIRDLARIPEGDLFTSVITILREEYKDQKSYLLSLSSFLTSKSREIKFLHELSNVLQTSMELDEILSVAMTAITSGKGFGMNRAFLLMADKDQKTLKGHLGVGPRNYEEAWQIWDEVDRSNFSLNQLSKQFYKTKLSSERAKFQDILELLSTPCGDATHIFNISLREKRPILVEHASGNPQIDDRVRSALGVEQFLIMPLISRNRNIGILLTDNFVTNKPIAPRDMQTMQTFAFPVAFAIERASLYERLQEEVEKLSRANIKLQEQQQLIVRMEKMAVVGRVTSSIAHSIRNPLTAIGGYARSLLKNPDNILKRKEYLEYIVTEAKHLDKVLEDVLNYSDSIHPVIDYWDINQLVISVITEIEPTISDRNVFIETTLDPDLPPAKLDYKQISFCLKTVMTHIAENQPDARHIQVKTFRRDKMLVITVSDDGAPLPREIKESLIAPFSSTEELGIGVGLPLCKIILEKNGNGFEIEEGLEGGNRYSIKLPQSTEEAQ